MASVRSRIVAGLCGVLAAGGLSGCGDSYAPVPVRGKVMTCEGKPAAGGEVTFVPIDAPDKTGRPAGNPGRLSRGTVGDDGTFTLTSPSVDGKPPGDGAVSGPHRVAFRLPPTTRPKITADDRLAMSEQSMKAMQERIDRMPVYPPLPCSSKIQPGEVEVKAGTDNAFEFTLPPK